MLKGIKVWNLRHLLDDVPFLGEQFFPGVQAEELLSCLGCRRFLGPASLTSVVVAGPPSAIRAHSVADLRGHPVPRSCSRGRWRQKEGSEAIYQPLLSSVRSYKADHCTGKRRQAAPAWVFKLCTPRYLCSLNEGSLGPQDIQSGSPEAFPLAWCLVVYNFPFFLPVTPSEPVWKSESLYLSGTGICFSEIEVWAPSERRLAIVPHCMFYYVGFICVSHEMSWDTQTHFR